MLNVTHQSTKKACIVSSKSLMPPWTMMKSSTKLQEKLSETDFKKRLIVTNRDGERSGQTEKKPSRLLQRLLVVMLIASKSAHRLPTKLNTPTVLLIITTQVLNNVVLNANASTQLLRSTGEASTTRRLPRKDTANPSPNSLRRNAPNWLTPSKPMKNHKNSSDHFYEPFSFYDMFWFHLNGVLGFWGDRKSVV